MQTIEVKTADLIGHALDWAVAKAEGYEPIVYPFVYSRGFDVYRDLKQQALGIYYAPSINWTQGGPLIEHIAGFELKIWLESHPETRCEAHIHNHDGDWIAFGPAPLVAAMRCLVAAKLGATVHVPVELLK